MRNFLTQQQGLTLLELMIGLALIIVLLTSIVTVQLYALRNVQSAQNISNAAQYARLQAQRVRIIRDITGIPPLLSCTPGNKCYINDQLQIVTPIPTGQYEQAIYVEIADNTDCPIPTLMVTPGPTIYKVITRINWNNGITITPVPEQFLETCLSNWK